MATATEITIYDNGEGAALVRLAQYDDEKLISRSQAKRLLDRIDKFKVVIFDFAEVETIGQAFADEIFRVFRRQHPDIEIVYLNASDSVRQMIDRNKNMSIE